MARSTFDPTLQKWCAACGTIAVLMFFLPFAIAGWIPPPSPEMSPEEVAAMYKDKHTRILVGMVIMSISGTLTTFFVALISHHLRRMEGEQRLMSMAQTVAGASAIAYFIQPGAFWCIAAFRPDRSIELTYFMNDFAFVFTFLIWAPTFMQNLSIGIAILRDRSGRAEPIFPRWFGYYQFWTAIGMTGGSFLPFFYKGPFAWNGLFPFWLAGTLYVSWYFITPYMMMKATEHERRELIAAGEIPA